MSGPREGAQAQPPVPPAESAAEGGIEARVAELEAQLAEATAEAGRARDEWLRAKAETDNVRRRGQEDVSKAHRYGLESFAGALLAVKDSLDAALTVENTSIESFREGMELTSKQLESVFQKFAVTEEVPQGRKFDPNRHQAISQVESEAEPGTVVTVLQKGYMLNDRVLRPALVVVSKARDL
jgi:molecular chaperone GrpE